MAFLVTLGAFAIYFASKDILYLVFVLIMIVGAVIAIIGLVQRKTQQRPRRAVFWGEVIIVWGFSFAWFWKAINSW